MVSPNDFGESQWPLLANQEIIYSYNLTTDDVERNGNIHQNGHVHQQNDLQETALDDNRTHDVQVVSVATPLSSVIPLRKNIACSPYNSGIDHYNEELDISTPVSNVADLDFNGPDVQFKNGSLENVYVKNQVEIPGQSAPPTLLGTQFRAEKKSNAMVEEKMNKSFEKRQRRMIKNRESAARSRAKKQAYTNQLERDVQQLKMKNDLMKRRTELQRKWTSSTSRSEPCRYQLRRTRSF
ncbi:hypothetical protein LIER_04215 [Lithospermum erythrorhizon]|uniref:BZIP domain-containing protein n=1 Tax=Lithospermum erythrorhizon TaxID=34254 RepID=A0AAV3NWD1_LITER